jgi:hypothetical protein
MASVAPPVTPVAGTNSAVAVGGTPVQAAPGDINGGFIVNPNSATESIFVDPVAAPGLVAQGTTCEIRPGGIWNLIPGQTTPTFVNAATNGHKFNVVVY